MNDINSIALDIPCSGSTRASAATTRDRFARRCVLLRLLPSRAERIRPADAPSEAELRAMYPEPGGRC
jgi:hypothetical protein